MTGAPGMVISWLFFIILDCFLLIVDCFGSLFDCFQALPGIAFCPRTNSPIWLFWGPVLLAFKEMVEQPIIWLFYWLFNDEFKIILIFLLASPGCHLNLPPDGPLAPGNGQCDDDNNNCGCGWDGGDCCGSNVNKSYCKECKCLDPTNEW